MEQIRKHFKKIKQKEKGFTLVELIVVIAIIGVLAGIMLPKYFGFTDDARKNACLAEAKNISGIIQTYYAKYGEMPTIADGNATTSATVTLDDEGSTVYTFDGYFSTTPTFDATDKTLNFQYVKKNGTATSGLYEATCDDTGNITVEEKS